MVGLLLDGAVPEVHVDAALRPLLDLGDVAVRDAEHAEDHQRRQLVGELGHQIGVAAVRETVDHRGGDRADVGLQRGDAPRRERLLDEAPQPRVIGGLAARETGDVGEAAIVEDPLDLRRARLERRLGVLGGERRRVAEDLADVRVAGDDPVVDRRAVEDRRLRPGAPVKGERLRGVKRLEVAPELGVRTRRCDNSFTKHQISPSRNDAGSQPAGPRYRGVAMPRTTAFASRERHRLP